MNEDTAVNALISDLNEKAKEIAKLVADNNLLEEENTQLIDGNVFLEDAAMENLSCNNEGYDECDNCNYVEYVECYCNVCLKKDNVRLLERERTLEEGYKAQEDLITKIITDKLEDGDLPNKYLEDVRCMYEKDVRNMEARFVKEEGIHKKRINETSLLKADVRRLEKLMKALAEDNMRLRLPVKECLDKGIIPLVEKPPLGEIKKRPGIEFDPWVEWLDAYDGNNKMDCQHLSKKVQEQFNDPMYIVQFIDDITGSKDFSINFISACYGGSWTIPSSLIKDMNSLKYIYNNFKEIYG